MVLLGLYVSGGLGSRIVTYCVSRSDLGSSPHEGNFDEFAHIQNFCSRMSRSVSRGQTWVHRLTRGGLMGLHISRIYVLECHGLCLEVRPESLALIGF